MATTKSQEPKRILKCHSCGLTGGSDSFECSHCGSLVTEIVERVESLEECAERIANESRA